MTNIKLLLSIGLLTAGLMTYGQQSGGLFAQEYSKELTEFMAKEFIINEVLNVPNKEVIDFEIYSLTAAKSGELTTVIYNCKALNKRGLVLVFWNSYINEFNLKYKGYAFRNFDFEDAKQFLESIEIVMEQKKNLINYDNENLSKNAIFKWDDIVFVFYKGDLVTSTSNLIRVFWKGLDSGWNQANLNTAKRRFEKFFLSNK
jgi:hypothetical protein